MLRLHPFFAALSIREYLQSTVMLRGWPTLVLLLLNPSKEAAWTLRHISSQCESDCGFLLGDYGFHVLTVAIPQDCSSSSHDCSFMHWQWLHLKTVAKCLMNSVYHDCIDAYMCLHEQHLSFIALRHTCVSMSSVYHWLRWCIYVSPRAAFIIDCVDAYMCLHEQCLSLIALMRICVSTSSVYHWLRWCVYVSPRAAFIIGCVDAYMCLHEQCLSLTALMCICVSMSSVYHWLYWCIYVSPQATYLCMNCI